MKRIIQNTRDLITLASNMGIRNPYIQIITSLLNYKVKNNRRANLEYKYRIIFKEQIFRIFHRQIIILSPSGRRDYQQRISTAYSENCLISLPLLIARNNDL